MFEKVDEFMGSYLHQDWDTEYDNAEDAARSFAGSVELGLIAEVIGEIAILTAGEAEERVKELWTSSAWDYYPGEGEYAKCLISLSKEMAVVAASRLDDGTTNSS